VSMRVIFSGSVEAEMMSAPPKKKVSINNKPSGRVKKYLANFACNTVRGDTIAVSNALSGRKASIRIGCLLTALASCESASALLLFVSLLLRFFSSLDFASLLVSDESVLVLVCDV